MENLYLFDAGATKTALVYLRDGKRQELDLPAFNPNRMDKAFVKAMNENVDIGADANVFFYGSGLGTKANRDFVSTLFAQHSVKKLNIYDDIVGAARAAFNESTGIICIMGTGGLAAYYDGKRIEKRRGGHGYLIDDLGGGFELGRRILSAWLNGDFSQQMSESIQKSLGYTEEELIYQVYQKGRIDLISNLSKMITSEIKEEKFMQILDHYFEEFIQQNIVPLSKEFHTDRFSIVGSLGTAYYRRIGDLAKSSELRIDQCIQSPVQRLFEFHLRY
ncbi:MAG: hypothetical protein WDZ35_15015 [Crocinitomicaceae bacterium]